MSNENIMFGGGHNSDANHLPAPIYLQIKRWLLQKINSGEWAANYKIPSEQELANMFSVSRMTAHRALRELSTQGVLVRVQGVGTFVSENKVESTLMSVRNIADEIRSNPNHEHNTKVILIEQCLANQELASIFDIKLKQLLFHSVLLHYDNNIPVQLEDRYVSSVAAPNYMTQDYTHQTPHVYLTSVAPLTEGEHIVEAVLASEQEAAWLEISDKEPCLQMRRRTWSNQIVVTCARLLYPGSRYRLEGHFYS